MPLDRISPSYGVLNRPDALATGSQYPCTTKPHTSKKRKPSRPDAPRSGAPRPANGDVAGATSEEEITESSLESYFHKLENILHTLDTCNRRIIDQQSENLYAFASELRQEFVKGPMAKAEAVVRYLESTTIGHEISDLALPEKVARGVDYIEQVVENSQVSNAIQTALSSACDRLLTYEELPSQWQENPYITGGYRFNGSLRECVMSVFKMHNETINIWTHIAGILLFLALGVFHMPYTQSWQLGTWWDRAPMVIFVAAALKCLLCSVCWHSGCSICHLDVKKKLACVDYTGITICICASILTTEYSVLKCHPQAQAFYMFITLTTGGLGLMMSWNPKFDSAGAKPMRALFFCCFAVFGGLSGIHAIFYRGLAETWSYYAPVVKSIMCYFVGVLFYASLFPEKYIKGFNSNWGMSHNIWHCFVVAGIYYHYKAMLEMFSKAVTEVCPLK